MLTSTNTGSLAYFLCYTPNFLREKSKIDYGLYLFFTYLVVELSYTTIILTVL